MLNDIIRNSIPARGLCAQDAQLQRLCSAKPVKGQRLLLRVHVHPRSSFKRYRKNIQYNKMKDYNIDADTIVIL